MPCQEDILAGMSDETALPGQSLPSDRPSITRQGCILAAGERISSSPFQDGPLLQSASHDNRPMLHRSRILPIAVPNWWSGSFQ